MLWIQLQGTTLGGWHTPLASVWARGPLEFGFCTPSPSLQPSEVAQEVCSLTRAPWALDTLALDPCCSYYSSGQTAEQRSRSHSAT